MTNTSTYSVKVMPNQSPQSFQYASLADMWSEWNGGYLEVDYPRLMIRFEDTIFHAEEVMRKVSQCVGIPMRNTYQYYLKEAKSHGNSVNFLTAMSRYGTDVGRIDNLTIQDLMYARTALDSELMEILHYQYAS